MLQIKRTNSSDNDFHLLIGQLDKYLLSRYGDLQNYYGQFNKIENLETVVLAYINGEVAGCGCFKKFDDESVEVKRMFVVEQHRGKAIGAAILDELEKWAGEIGNRSTVLELGNNQPEAIRLYLKQGYQVIANYGQYVGMETSICLKKEII